MRARTASLIFVMTLGYALGATTDAAPKTDAAKTPAAKAAPVTFEKNIQPLLQQYCYECHGNGEHSGEFAIDSFKTEADVLNNTTRWETVLSKLSLSEMPPMEAAQVLPESDRAILTHWIDDKLHPMDPANPDPGRNILHRLNRAEYDASIRDLVGLDFHPADDFPADDSGNGFDNNGDVLSLPPMLLEKYLAAADKILDQAIYSDHLENHEITIPVADARIGFNAIGLRDDGFAELKSLEEDDVAVDVPIPAPGEYKVSFLAYGTPTGGFYPGNAGTKQRGPAPDPAPPPQMSIRLGETYVKQFAVTADKDHPDYYSTEIGVPTGVATFRFVMDHIRGGANELAMVNGRIGFQQYGLGFVKSIKVEGPLNGAIHIYPASQLTPAGEVGLNSMGDRVIEKKDGDVSVKFNVTKAGEYILRACAYAQTAGPDPARMELRVDDQPVQTFDVTAPAKLRLLPGQSEISSALNLLRPIPQIYEIHLQLTPGEKKFSAAFLNDFADPDNTNPNQRQRTLIVQNLEVVDLSAPFIEPVVPDALKPYFTKQPTPQNKIGYARDVLTKFARRAWRRPPEGAEIDRLMGLFNLADAHGDNFLASVKLAMKAVLVSPNFLFRGDSPLTVRAAATLAKTEAPKVVEPAATPTSVRSLGDGVKLILALPEKIAVKEAPPAPKPAAVKTTGDSAAQEIIPAFAPTKLGVPVDEYTLASRLSYFLWSSIPDDELLDLAAHNQLRQHLTAEVRRMLASPKARALVDNFAGQWLQFRSLETFAPDPQVYKSFNSAVGDDMRTETAMFFEHIMREDLSVMDFITADYTFVNENLANYYGLPGVTGDNFQMVSLKDTPRRGVATQGSVLVLTSNPTRTSPVKRGKWVLENLLGTPPPPPPPNVPALDNETELTGTLRQQMEQHRANPTCASCHARMDPIGFGLENFDGAGRWRDTEGAAQTPIDASGTLVTGESFNGAAELMQIMAGKKRDDFLRCISEKMLTYALGRGLEYYDRPATEQIKQQLDQNGDKFSALVLGVVNSIPFQQMRREHAAPAAPPAAKLAAE